uniref:DUF927 domain-containing protein n=1 Tax=Meloidogyne hapla TaxID=6305 RepID=A0A1I8BSP8_MELHA
MCYNFEQSKDFEYKYGKTLNDFKKGTIVEMWNLHEREEEIKEVWIKAIVLGLKNGKYQVKVIENCGLKERDFTRNPEQLRIIAKYKYGRTLNSFGIGEEIEMFNKNNNKKEWLKAKIAFVDEKEGNYIVELIGNGKHRGRFSRFPYDLRKLIN